MKRAGSKEAEIKMIKKLFEIKTLKEIKLEINYINNDDIELIEGNNPTVEILTINFGSSNYTNKEIILYNFQKKLPNLKEIQIYIVQSHYNSYQDINKIIDINENNNCKINKFKFSEESNFFSTTKFFIHSFESLVSIEFGCMHNLYKLDESFPIFNENCKYNFKSLTKFIFINNKSWPNVIVDLKIIKNIINNLNKMPNIKSFILKCRCENITEEIYKKFIEEVLLSNIENIELDLNNYNYHDIHSEDKYSENDLKDICKGINLKNLENIIIIKIKN